MSDEDDLAEARAQYVERLRTLIRARLMGVHLEAIRFGMTNRDFFAVANAELWAQRIVAESGGVDLASLPVEGRA